MELAIVGGVFAQEIRLMARVQSVFAKPLRLWRWLMPGIAVPEPAAHGVLVSPSQPLVTHSNTILYQSILVPPPHPDSWMVLPAILWIAQGAQNLPGLDTLLAKSAAIQAGSRFAEIGIGKKGLHRVIVRNELGYHILA